ncbi:class I SAM-dependent methyltransferase [Lutibacter sp.]|uniref:class I SAM-dependent methyltransferase n=1 Tax=Lutibacter sp. TaxID=1925666 RepID=UPI0025BF7EB6|nr:class I SAM-dependent methyltransferase [Lutibacter sp.]MCF6181847.1 class I SAM-dependent methyltransferase [Lutibacter sp.]
MKTKNNSYLSCKDYLVSNEKFDLVYNKELDMLETTPVPSLDKLSSYYKSEEYISHTDASKTIFDKVYQLVKKINIKHKLNVINLLPKEEKKLLDIGCGTGDFLVACKKNNYKIFGVEPNEKANKIATKKIGESVYKNLDDINESKFDVITLWHVLEHVPNLDDYILKIKSLLKPNAILIIAVPNFKSFDANYYKQYWAAFDVPRHLWHFSKKSVQSIFLKHQINLVKILPMKFDAYYVALLSEKNKSKKSNFIKAFFVGCWSNFKAIRSKEYSSLIYVLKNE